MTEATVTLTGPQNLILHIEHLQRVITERNATILALQADLSNLRDATFEPSHPQLRQAWKDGYNACRSKVYDAQRVAIDMADALKESLRKANADAYMAEYAAEKSEFGSA